MNVKIGNTTIIDRIESFDFKKCIIGDQLMKINSFCREYFYEYDERSDLNYDEYEFYTITDCRFNNTLVNLSSVNVEFNIQREYDCEEEEDENGDIIDTAPKNIYTNSNYFDNDELCALTYNGKCMLIPNAIYMSQYDKSYKTWNEEFYDEINDKSRYCYHNNYCSSQTFKILNEQNNTKYFYNYFVVELNHDLKLSIFIKTALDVNTKRFWPHVYCLIFNDNEYKFIENRDNIVYKIFDFIYENTTKEVLKNNLDYFNILMNASKFDYVELLNDDYKKLLRLNLVCNDISLDEYKETIFKQIYVNDGVSCYFEQTGILIVESKLIFIKDNKKYESYIIIKEDYTICKALLAEFRNETPLSTRTGEIINAEYKCLYSDIECKILISKYGIKRYFYKLKGYYVEADQNSFEDKQKIKCINDKFNVLKKMEETL